MRIIKNLATAAGAAGMLLAGLGATAAVPASANPSAAMSRHFAAQGSRLPKGSWPGWHRVSGSWKVMAQAAPGSSAEYGHQPHPLEILDNPKGAWGKGTLADGLTQKPYQGHDPPVRHTR